MNIKNYTTEVPANRSIEYIEKLLVDFGASNIMKEYEKLDPLPGQRCKSISFIIQVDGTKLPFRLPANVARIRKWLSKNKPKSTPKWLSEQSERIAWKQQYEILHLQLGQVLMGQMETLEVFFPYLFDVNRNQSYYEIQKASGALLIGNGNSNS